MCSDGWTVRGVIGPVGTAWSDDGAMGLSGQSRGFDKGGRLISAWKREQLGRLWVVIGERVQEAQVAPIRPTHCNRSPKSVADSISYKYKAFGSVLAINFLRENSDKIVREKARERDRRLETKPCVAVFYLFRQGPDRGKQDVLRWIPDRRRRRRRRT